MGLIKKAVEIFRRYVTDGVPASGVNEPNKDDIRAWGTFLESTLGQVGLGYATLALLNADLAHGANTLAIVYSDATAANNGLYQKSGGSGSGAWTRVGDLPKEIVQLSVTGGTANAITATAIENPTVPGAKLYLLTPTANNTGATTITVNGGSAVPITNAFNSTLASGSLIAGSQVLMAWQTDHYQLLIAAAVDANPILADTVAARDAAIAARDAAIAAAASGAIASAIDRTALKAINTAGTKAAVLREAGREGVFIWETGDFAARIAADANETTYIKANAVAATSGAWMRVVSERNRVIPSVFAPLATFGLNSLLDCVAPLQATHNIDIEAIWDEKYGASQSGGQDLCVDFANGNDTTGNGTYAAPYKTVKKAMADAGGCRRIYMLGATSDEVPNWTAADGVLGSGLARAIKIIALTPGFIFRNPYESLGTFTWTASGSGYTATPVTTTRRLHAVQYLTLDLQYFASTAAVDTAGYGWTQNDSTGQIYINLGGLNVNALKGGLTGIWAGAAARISGACLYIKNCTFWGLTDLQLLYSQPGAVWDRPIVFMENCKVQYGSGSYNLGLLGYGIENKGGILVTKGCEFSCNALDGVNANPDALAGSGQEPWHVTIDDKFFSNGYVQSRAFVEFITANPGARNIQGISYHQGLVAQINSLVYDNYGQNIAHTQTTSTGGAWLVGVKAGSPRADMQAAQSSLVTPFPKTSAINSRFANVELQSANTWVDTCAAGGRDSTYGLVIPNGAKVFNGRFDGFTGAIQGAVTAYDPANPG
ncbi:hypothetical protein ABID65_003323 [Bradyrhizobium sp. S3.9.2]|uniref:hypothetical protein n=1 Tax=Bradyrhizobium sp. S3.9.2 TaxID=3156432 RepID=UPI00339B9C1D